MPAETKDETRTFPNGVTRQTVTVVIDGFTYSDEWPGKKPIPDKQALVLELDPTATAYDTAGIENEVIKKLYDVHLQLARERGESAV